MADVAGASIVASVTFTEILKGKHIYIIHGVDQTERKCIQFFGQTGSFPPKEQ